MSLRSPRTPLCVRRKSKGGSPSRRRKARGRGGRGGALRATEPQVARQRRRCAAAPSAAHRRRRLVAGRWPSPGERPHAGVGSSPRRREGDRRRPRVPSLLAPASSQQPHAPAARCQSEPVQPTCWNYQMKPVTGGMDNQNTTALQRTCEQLHRASPRGGWGMRRGTSRVWVGPIVAFVNDSRSVDSASIGGSIVDCSTGQA